MLQLKKIYNIFFKSKWQPILLIVIIGFLLYIPSLGYDYHYLDDNILIKDNFYKINNLSYITDAFKEGVFPGRADSDIYYRPLLTVSFIIDAQFGNESLISFHFTNILLHLISSCLIFLILLKLGVKKQFAWLFSLIFVIHPINVHAVSWIPGRNDPLLAIMFIGAFLSFLHFLKSKKIWQYILYIILFFLSLLTKETALVLPILTLIYLYLIHREKIFSKFSIINFIVLASTTVAWFIIRNIAMGKAIAEDYNIISSLLQNSPAIFSYLGKILFIHNLSVFPIISDLPLIFGIITFIALTVAIYFSKNVKWSNIVFGALWFLGTLAPSMIKTVSTQAQVVEFAEHRVYLSLLGLIIILSQINIPIKKYKNIFIILMIITCSLFLAKSITHSKVYENKTTFWTNAVEYSPSSAFNHNNLGAMYYLDGNYNLAEKEWVKASKLNPQEKLVQNNLGLIYASKKEYDKAYTAYMAELAINPDYPNTHFNLGLLLYNTNNIEQGISEWETTIKLDPEYFAAYEYLATHYINEKDISKAQKYINQMIKLGATPSKRLLDILE
ncbi:tetratricopeptide repeat protein [Patescibacteria group bacterium]|nr:tetratricopeptide repeat protein [Patescibacteria group bacterium]